MWLYHKKIRYKIILYILSNHSFIFIFFAISKFLYNYLYITRPWDWWNRKLINYLSYKCWPRRVRVTDCYIMSVTIQTLPTSDFQWKLYSLFIYLEGMCIILTFINTTKELYIYANFYLARKFFSINFYIYLHFKIPILLYILSLIPLYLFWQYPKFLYNYLCITRPSQVKIPIESHWIIQWD